VCIGLLFVFGFFVYVSVSNGSYLFVNSGFTVYSRLHLDKHASRSLMWSMWLILTRVGLVRPITICWGFVILRRLVMCNCNALDAVVVLRHVQTRGCLCLDLCDDGLLPAVLHCGVCTGLCSILCGDSLLLAMLHCVVCTGLRPSLCGDGFVFMRKNKGRYNHANRIHCVY
jgi:hypothetical protein